MSFLVIMLHVGIRGLFEYYTAVDHISFPYGHGQLGTGLPFFMGLGN
jgi:hypothetical protein